MTDKFRCLSFDCLRLVQLVHGGPRVLVVQSGTFCLVSASSGSLCETFSQFRTGILALHQ